MDVDVFSGFSFSSCLLTLRNLVKTQKHAIAICKRFFLNSKKSYFLKESLRFEERKEPSFRWSYHFSIGSVLIGTREVWQKRKNTKMVFANVKNSRKFYILIVKIHIF